MSFLDILQTKVTETEKGIIFIHSHDSEEFVPYSEIYQRAGRVLHHLQRGGMKKNDKLILQLETADEFVYSLWACMMGGIIPIPISQASNDDAKRKLCKIFEVSSPCKMIYSGNLIEKLEKFEYLVDNANRYEHIKNNSFSINSFTEEGDFEVNKESDLEDIAFVQFSSGSTGDPKGVIVKHKNVLANVKSITSSSIYERDETMLSWLPLSHDFGLIGFHLNALYNNFTQYIIETDIFVRNPLIWINKASEHKINYLFSPNFGYKHFMNVLERNRIKNRPHAEWDLSNVKGIYNGAEPISIDICNQFLDSLADSGLKKEVFRGAYGLAESTLAVTITDKNKPLEVHIIDRTSLYLGNEVEFLDNLKDKNATVLVDLGLPVDNCHLIIVDNDGNELEEKFVGHICIKGDSMTSGYLNNEEATKNAFLSGEWLKTGDLGFILHGRLVITGRYKDLIIINGRNYYPHDIEKDAEKVEGIDLGTIVATRVYNSEVGGEELLVFVLFKKGVEQFIGLSKKIKSHITNSIGIDVKHVIPIKKIPKTTSGKFQRYKLAQNYIDGKYDGLLEEMSRTEQPVVRMVINCEKDDVFEDVIRIWTKTLGHEEFAEDDNFFDVGGDSKSLVKMCALVNKRFPNLITTSELFGMPTVRELSEYICTSVGIGG